MNLVQHDNTEKVLSLEKREREPLYFLSASLVTYLPNTWKANKSHLNILAPGVGEGVQK